jgi:hypothetical protein
MVLDAGDAHRAVRRRRREQPVDDELGHRVRHSDRELGGARRRPAAQRLAQLAPEREDLVGVAVHHASGLGQRHRPSLPLEQTLAQRALQPLHLRADARLRDAQLLRRPRYTTLAGDHPEVEEVVVVEPVHVGFYLSAKLSFSSKLCL